MYVIIVTRSEVCVVEHEVESVAILDSVELFTNETSEEGTKLTVCCFLFGDSSRKHVDVGEDSERSICFSEYIAGSELD